MENEKQKNLELQMMKEQMTKQQESMKKHDDTMVKILQKFEKWEQTRKPENDH